MSRPDTKTTAVEVGVHDGRNGHYMGAGTTAKINDASTEQQLWVQCAHLILAVRAASGQPFTAEDLRADGLGEPDKPSRWGHLFRKAADDGLIVPVGVMNSRRAQRHGSLSRVWVGAHGAGVAV